MDNYCNVVIELLC